MNETANSSLLGFHYFNNTEHFSQNDLEVWLPVLKSLNVSWLLLQSPTNRAIPEFFINELIAGGITPVLQFPEPIQRLDAYGDLDLLIATYAKWGIKHLILSDQPNMKNSWKPESWIKEDLVEQFTYPFMNVANQAINQGMKVFLPPLVPGGDYWDTVFLWEALKLLTTEAPENIKNIGISASTDIYTHDLEWGSGGPDNWPIIKPYHEQGDHQDQRGLHIYEWYDAISKAVVGQSLEILLLNIGKSPQSDISTAPSDQEENTLATVFGLLTKNPLELNKTLPPYVLGGFIHTLTSDSGEIKSWFKPDGSPAEFTTSIIENYTAELELQSNERKTHPIDHYLLLPTYEWGVADWHLDVVKPFIKKFQPTIGFSAREASFSRKVTVLGGHQVFPEEILNKLRTSGSEVHRIEGDGTELVSNISKQITN